ncbi:tyrosine-type recombinase/integrase [uncultured Dokdonia sp.]|uniref:tyrosine-type recombinase/integrase n=1 Tax=uncultured Dokdonia sp. TaxID=575653 RepID=UPI0026180DBD|nr:tyrosine-type recombinase/integrase [uncultured Dokdonia sp.]
MFLQSFIDYLSLEKKYSSHTVLAYEKDIEAFYAFAKANYDQIELQEVHYSQIRSWIVSLVDEGISNRSINRKVSSLKSFYKFLVKMEAIKVSPLVKHKALKTSKRLQIPFSENEVSEVFDLLSISNDFESIRDLLLLELLYGTGMRRAELIGLTIGSVDVSQKTIRVIGKRNKERLMPLLPNVCVTISKYLEKRNEVSLNEYDAPLLITKKGVKLYDTLVYRIINHYFSKTSNKIKKSPHIIRHSFATHLLNQGADLNTLKDLLGHASLASTQVYTHNSIKTLRNVYNNAHPRNKK